MNKEEKKLSKLSHKIHLKLCYYLILNNKCDYRAQCKDLVKYCRKWQHEIDPFIRYFLIKKKGGKNG